MQASRERGTPAADALRTPAGIIDSSNGSAERDAGAAQHRAAGQVLLRQIPHDPPPGLEPGYQDSAAADNFARRRAGEVDPSPRSTLR